ncbi:hypothetical protein AUEXF2481DRAFT_607137 [Aureobasidium subglaciale EXF-2481]|uniref:Uncharacterized protein n=1 Tax=Aureobasidium subglaciale (strain EXF-2481) TaxID=1043005 RepID=A0A074XXA0_AURSE|nr:uncharacterized protein AUEXF2481DRAFT_607137 [Aureobasidium subglaciale EXF-2481]KEQ90193.1 hypothetical protein AUEXF2481DRAFT_607137 [Aureobasidium subglaciale EXF-2481]
MSRRHTMSTMMKQPLHDRRRLGIFIAWRSDPKQGHLACLGRSLKCGISRLTSWGVELWLLDGAGYLDAVSDLESLRWLTITRLSDFLDKRALFASLIWCPVLPERRLEPERSPPPLKCLDSKAPDVNTVILNVPKRFGANTNSQTYKDYARAAPPCSAETNCDSTYQSGTHTSERQSGVRTTARKHDRPLLLPFRVLLMLE